MDADLTVTDIGTVDFWAEDAVIIHICLAGQVCSDAVDFYVRANLAFLKHHQEYSWWCFCLVKFAEQLYL